MKVADLLESRKENWRQLDGLCSELENRRKKSIGAPAIARFTALYRAACADLALAESYQLPANTVNYLHRLVGRAHNQLYPSRKFNYQAWREELLNRVPQRLFSDPCVWLAFLLFWGIFLLSMFFSAEYKLLGSDRPPMRGYADGILGREAMEQLQENFSQPMDGRNPANSALMAGFYIRHNTGIGLKCFAGGLLFGVGGLFATVFNAAYLGAAFGYMLRVPERDNFFQFVTAHGPFELTAIVLSAAAGMRLGFSQIATGGYSRLESLRRAGKEIMPTMGAVIILFFLAALIEGFISPSGLPYMVKALVAITSCGLLVFYFVMLGWPRQSQNVSE